MPTPEFILSLRRQVGHALLHLPTVGVLAEDAAGRLLLVRDRQDGRWTCPGGIVEPHELPADAAVREAWEEAGVRVALTHIVGVFGGPDCRTDYANGDRIAWVATIFGARATGGTARAQGDGDETSAAAWHDAAALQALPLKPHLRLFLRARDTGRPGWFQPAGWAPPDDASAG